MPISDLLDKKKYLPKNEISARLAICMACPEFRRLGERCKVCGCFVKLKAKLSTENCPLKKWPGDK